jgi:hypothetical protein
MFDPYAAICGIIVGIPVAVAILYAVDLVLERMGL